MYLESMYSLHKGLAEVRIFWSIEYGEVTEKWNNECPDMEIPFDINKKKVVDLWVY